MMKQLVIVTNGIVTISNEIVIITNEILIISNEIINFFLPRLEPSNQQPYPGSQHHQT